MTYPLKKRLVRTAALTALLATAVAACGGDDDSANNGGNGGGGGAAGVAPSYQLTLTNLTAGQPMSPVVAIIHDQNYQLFSVGQAAGIGLERLAEGAETDPLLAETAALDAVKGSATSTGGPIGPGGATSFTVTANSTEVAPGSLRLSLATMLVNTNDAIAAINSTLDVAALEVGQSAVINLISYDTGTEANSESATTMPGPAAGGEGFNSVRDDVRDAVHVHQGPVTNEDGLTGSVLTGIHRWQHSVARLTVRRLN